MSLEPKYISKENLDERAEKLLSRYRGGTLLAVAAPLDIEHFAEFELDAKLDYQRLSADDSVLGMSVFQDLTLPVASASGARAHVEIPARTIVIDDRALDDSPEGRFRFTIAHECAHLILHSRIFYRDPSMSCPNKSGYLPFTAETENVGSEKFNRGEFQANYLGAALLMPRMTFSRAFHEFVPLPWAEMTDRNKRQVVSQLADLFNVSPTAAALRIKHLELAS
nr:MAG TPA: IrrE N-terminal-like domain [Caudoviricetes sp.]DAR51556.1 MAG TPA: IrrE N-terminal-like domain [Caudoviricetes sp.]